MTGYIPAPSTGGGAAPVGSLLTDPLTGGGEVAGMRYGVPIVQAAMALGSVWFGAFRAQRTEDVGKIAVYITTIHTGAPTLQKMGVYSVAANGDMALVASTANDTTIGAAAGERVRNLTSTFHKVAGTLYACAFVSVGGTTAPSPLTYGGTGGGNLAILNSRLPRTYMRLNAQADLPANIAVASLDTTQIQAPVFTLLP